MSFDIKQFLDGKRIVLVGCGREGISTYRFIRSMLPVQELTIADQDVKLVDKYPEFIADSFLEFNLGSSYLSSLNDYDLIIKAPGVSFKDLLEQPSREKISSQTDLFLRMYSKQVTGITGTKGKSTTSSLIRHIIGKSTDNVILVGNIGVPPFDMLDQINKETFIICELSSHQLQYITVAPHISILLNLFEEHLDHYNSFWEYEMSKLNIGLNQGACDHFIYNHDDLRIAGLLNSYSLPGIKHPFSVLEPVLNGAWSDSLKMHVSLSTDTLFYDLNAPRYLPGQHNVLNIMATVLACLLNGIPSQLIIEGIGDFKGLEHRIEYVGDYHGIRYYNDSISTIPQATIAAVTTLKEVDTLILGGFDRGIDYTILIDFVASSSVRNLIFIGKAGERICKMLSDGGIIDKHFFMAANFDEVALLAKENTRPGSICLLSPAAASYDMFKNFEERGKVFKEKVSCVFPY
jgi:UDP-N-acetylmuramoylalanine--D-glutamate ligase